MDITKFRAIADELVNAYDSSRRFQFSQAVGLVEILLRLQGVIYPGKGCFCLKTAGRATDEEVRAYYTALFRALRQLGLTDADLLSIVEVHEGCGDIKYNYEGTDRLSVEHWVTHRSGICNTEVHWWAYGVAAHLLREK